MGLQVWLPLDGNINNQGLSDATISSSNITYSDGKLGNAATFSSSYIGIKNTPITGTINELSFSFWMKTSSPTSIMCLYNGRISIGSAIALFTIGGVFRFDDGTQHTLNYTIPSNTWEHYCVTRNNSEIKLYVNGVLKATTVSSECSTTATNATIGASSINAITGNNNFLTGQLNDYRIYDTCLSPRQVREISKGLVCHYPLGEVDGKIGGRNLLRQSSLVGEQLMCYGIDNMNSVTTKSYEEEGYHIVTPSTGNGNNGVGFKYRDFTSLGIKQGDTITFSCDIKGTSDTHSPFIKIHFSAKAASHIWWGVDSVNSVGVSFIPLENKWQRISVSFTIPDTSEWTGNNMWLAIHGNFESNLYVRNLKLEKSSTATPWTPAPEDDASFYDNVIYDTSGYGNNGSVSGDILWDTDTPRYKGAYDFNGTGYIYNDNLNLTTTTFTISFWIKIPSTITHQHFDFATFNGWTSEGVAIYWDTSGQTSSSGAIFGEDPKGDKIHVAVQCKGKLNEWTHFAITWDGTKVYRYSNGIKFSESDFNAVSVYHPRLWLGNSTFGDRTLENSESCMSDFRFYTTALSDSDILELYQSSASVDNNGNLMLAGEVIEE